MTNQDIYDLIARFENSSVHSMKLSVGDFSMELQKGSAASPCAAPAAITPAAVPSAASAEANNDGSVITAPLVGTYYAASSPDAAPLVTAGTPVKKGQTVCLIEAMKMVSEIPAPCDCIITEILKENGSLVAFNEAIFRYTPC